MSTKKPTKRPPIPRGALLTPLGDEVFSESVTERNVVGDNKEFAQAVAYSCDVLGREAGVWTFSIQSAFQVALVSKFQAGWAEGDHIRLTHPEWTPFRVHVNPGRVGSKDRFLQLHTEASAFTDEQVQDATYALGRVRRALPVIRKALTSVLKVYLTKHHLTPKAQS